MILPKFDYKKARSIAEAIDLYRRFDGQARYLAGGTDLVPLLKQRLALPAAVIDLKQIDELRSLSGSDGWLTIGAAVTLFELKNHPAVKGHFPVLYESLDATSCETLQMRGTVGGNILQNTRCLLYNKSAEWRAARGLCYKMGGETCNVVPKARACFSNYCSDNAPALVALAATATLVGPGGERTVDLVTLLSGDGKDPFTLGPGEILTRIRVPLEKRKGAYEKLRVRDSMDYPLAGVAVSMKGSSATVCVGGVGPALRRYELPTVSDRTIQEAAEKAHEEAKPVMNATVSPLYRKKMVGALLKKALKRCAQGGAK